MSVAKMVVAAVSVGPYAPMLRGQTTVIVVDPLFHTPPSEPLTYDVAPYAGTQAAPAVIVVSARAVAGSRNGMATAAKATIL